jgi:transposase
MGKNSRLAAGIDTGKYKLDVALDGSKESLQVDNDAAGHQQLSVWLAQHKVKRVGIEASGGYERAVVSRLRADGFLVIVFQPAQVRAYAKFLLQRAKNDKIDAALIAACTTVTTKIHAPPDPRMAQFAEHLTLIEQIEEDIVRFKTRLEGFHDTDRRSLIKHEIARLTAWRRLELKHLIARLREQADLAHRLDLVETIPGIGPRTALALVVRMPELGTITRERAAALIGFAPYDNDSADQAGKRHCVGGRGRPRRSVYAAALPAAFRWNPHLVVFYKRLIAAGKPHKVALVACARKLIIYANTVLSRGTPWVEKPVAS